MTDSVDMNKQLAGQNLLTASLAADEPQAPELTGSLHHSINEGGSYVLKSNDLFYQDADSDISVIKFSVSAIVGGTLSLNGVALGEGGEFSASDIQAGLVSFQHDDSEDGIANFFVTVFDDGGIGEGGTFNFSVTPINDAPVLLTFPDVSRTVTENVADQPPYDYQLTIDDFYYEDKDDDSSHVLFTVSNLQHGAVLVTNNLGEQKVRTTFSAADLENGLVWFRQNGDDAPTASFDVKVEDGNEDNSPPVTATISFNVENVNDPATFGGTLKGTVKEILSPTVSGTLTAKDPDNSPAFELLTNVTSDYGYGTFSIDATGKWTYKLTAAPADLGLNTGDTIDDTVTIYAADGESYTQVAITIQGLTDVLGTNGNDRGAAQLMGSTGQDYMRGYKGADVMFGARGNDTLIGDAGDDQIHGDNAKRSSKDGKDTLDGGAGKDQLWGGGGADTFIFDDGDTVLKANGRDVIKDFAHSDHDKVDLSLIDANHKTAANDAFKWATTEKAALASVGTLFWEVDGKHGTLYMNTDAKKGFEMAIDFDGVKSISHTDFVL